jgi:hypothetical protein
MAILNNLDRLDRLFVVWAFLFQILLILHFAIRKPLMVSYTEKFGWIVYALCIPAVMISIILLRGGKHWGFWLGGFIFILFAAFGYWVDYVAKIPFRNPLRLDVLIPYVFLYLTTVMFYWFPLGRLDRQLWIVYGFLFVIATIFNIFSH